MIRDFIQPGGPENKRSFAAHSPAVLPVGGALLFLDQINDIPGLRAQDRYRLRSVTTAIPGSTPVNINTASVDLLVSLIPQVPSALLYQILNTRQTEPFGSIDSFLEALKERLGDDLPEDLPTGRLTVSSDWFQIDATAELENQTARRTTMMFRIGRQTGTLVRWQISHFD